MYIKCITIFPNLFSHFETHSGKLYIYSAQLNELNVLWSRDGIYDYCTTNTLEHVFTSDSQEATSSL